MYGVQSGTLRCKKAARNVWQNLVLYIQTHYSEGERPKQDGLEAKGLFIVQPRNLGSRINVCTADDGSAADMF